MAQDSNDYDRIGALDIAEGFHLAFLVALGAHAAASTWALKGGGNLRFYFDSLRYSEDIDLDAFVSATQLTARVEKTFESALLKKLLAALGAKVEYLNPKDRTPTKERWTIGLAHSALPVLTYTQIEISYREYDLAQYVVVEAPKSQPAVGHPPVPPPLIGHYVPRGAIIQKVNALRDRRHTQPRDVFDLDHLFRKFPSAAAVGLIDNRQLVEAVERLFQLEYAVYLAKVVTFLEPAMRAAYGTESHWHDTQLRVAVALEAMRQ